MGKEINQLVFHISHQVSTSTEYDGWQLQLRKYLLSYIDGPARDRRWYFCAYRYRMGAETVGVIFCTCITGLPQLDARKIYGQWSFDAERRACLATEFGIALHEVHASLICSEQGNV
jgi:hypothetical protein